ncbi:MAG: hypothetical protein ACTJLK_00845 [Anaplasma sp.]
MTIAEVDYEAAETQEGGYAASESNNQPDGQEIFCMSRPKFGVVAHRTFPQHSLALLR